MQPTRVASINFACRFGYLMTKIALVQAFSSFGSCQFGNARMGRGLERSQALHGHVGEIKSCRITKWVMLVGGKPMVCTSCGGSRIRYDVRNQHDCRQRPVVSKV